ncbi:MAG: lipoprotein [Pseudoxanthomonas sp.]
MNKSIQILLSAALVAALAGCGAKGPLLLPEKVVPIEAPVDEPTDNTPQIDGVIPAPADQQAEDAVEDPVPAATDD